MSSELYWPRRGGNIVLEIFNAAKIHLQQSIPTLGGAGHCTLNRGGFIQSKEKQGRDLTTTAYWNIYISGA